MIIKYIPLLVLLFFSLKLLISYVEKSTNSLKNKVEDSKIENGILSIKDLQKNNYDRFIKTIEYYLKFNGFTNISLIENGTSELTSFTATLNNEKIYISCSQNTLLGKEAKDEDNWSLTGRPDIQCFLARIISNNYSKGIFITNSSFTPLAIDFVNEVNNKNSNIELKLINGYELTRLVRNFNDYCFKEDLINEV